MTSPAARTARQNRLFEDLVPRAVASAGTTSRYSRFVGLMKLVLPLAAAALVGLVVAWPDAYPRRGDAGEAFSTPDSSGANDAGMERVRYVGVDGEGRPFLITASTVAPARGGDAFLLSELQADMTMHDGSWITVMAPTGQFDRRAGTLQLSGEVGIFADNGFEVHLASALVDLNRGTAHGDGPVQGQGPLGQLDAQSVDVSDRGRRMLFGGGVKMVVRPGGAPR